MNEIIERHSNPLFARKNIFKLDGEWEISIDGGKMQKIRVPYCPESELSGIRHKGFIRECEYRKVFTLPAAMQNGKVLLRFGAVNYFARVYVNGKCAGSHAGGYTPFCFEVSEFLKRGENLIDVCVRNDLREGNPSGKQSPKRESFGCFYTRCTGIWQSVWRENVPAAYLQSVRFVPNAEENSVRMEVFAEGAAEFRAEISVGGKAVGGCGGFLNRKGSYTVSLSEKRLWELDKGGLYEVKLRFGQDEVYTYFGLRDVKYDVYRFLLNGKSVFQRLVLDQGYYPKGCVHARIGYEKLKELLDKADRGAMKFMNMYLVGESNGYRGEPQHLSEYGGVSYGGKRIEQTQCVRETSAWGYETVADEETFIENHERTARLTLGYGKLSGFCYTQLYDIEQEQNGLYTYDRKPKFSEQGMRRIRGANLTQAEIEKSNGVEPRL